MVEDPASTLIQMETSGLASMIAYEQFQNIKLMYDLFVRTKPSLKLFEEFISQQVWIQG